MSKDKSQHSSGTGNGGIIMRIISKEQITGLETTWIKVTCKKNKVEGRLKPVPKSRLKRVNVLLIEMRNLKRAASLQ